MAREIDEDDGEVVTVTPIAESESSPESLSDSSPDSSSVMVAVGDENSLDVIAQEVAACRKCALCETRKNTVFGVGNRNADWLFIGEAPGENEDAQGEPFVGAAGGLLDKIIAALGMSREQVFIANILKCRPPGNRDPKPEEIAECENYLHRQLAIIRPKIIVALGRISAQALLKTGEPLSRLRGRQYQYGKQKTPLIATYHPAYLLRSPSEKAKVWKDLWLAKEKIS